MEQDFYTIFSNQNIFLQSLLVLGLAFSTLGLLFKDALAMRALLLAGSLLALLYTFISDYSFLSASICLLAFANGLQLGNLVIDRFSLNIPDELRPFYNEVFNLMRPNEFLNLLRLGEKTTITKERQEYIFHEGDKKDVLMFILKGEVSIEKSGRQIASLGPNAFVGEMHYLTRQPMSADVKVLKDVSVIRWYHEQLDRLKMANPTSFANFLGVLSQDLVYKIQNTQMGDQ